MKTIEFNVGEHWWWNNSEGIDKPIVDIVNKYRALQEENKRLREENNELKSEQYKDTELAKLEEENQELKGNLYRGFGITEKEQNAISTWLKTHGCNSRHSGICEYRFSIIPGIGYNGYAKCACGKEFCFYEE